MWYQSCTEHTMIPDQWTGWTGWTGWMDGWMDGMRWCWQCQGLGAVALQFPENGRRNAIKRPSLA